MHIAISLGIPTVTILGGGHFERFMPYGDYEKNEFVYKKMDCFKCNWKCIFNLNVNDKPPCIKNIKLKQVVKVIKNQILMENSINLRK